MRILQFIFLDNKKKLVPLLLFAVILVFALSGVEDAAGSSGRLQFDLTERAIRRALADCYAIEGYYPPDLSYLYENYHVRVDEEKYFVMYEIFAPNIMPSVRLFDKRPLTYE